MRLFYRWFCRVIGVGSLLDMVNLYGVMLILILEVFIVTLPESVDSKKHRSPNRHVHHRHSNHRKHSRPRHHLTLDGNYSVKIKKRSNFSPKDLNIENTFVTIPWDFNQTSSFFNNSHIDREIILTSKNINSIKSTNPNYSQIFNELNSSNFENETQNFKTSNSNPQNFANSSSKHFNYILRHSSITFGATEKSTTQIFTQSTANSASIEEIEEIKSEATSINSLNITEIEEKQVAKDLQKLFGSVENKKKFTETEIPVVQLIRKKRSAEKKDAVDETKRESLLDFNGPLISNDSEEIEDSASSKAIHKRVKRDGSELEDDRSLDSTYLQNLEDSFALSALEVQARGSQKFSRAKRQIIADKKYFDTIVDAKIKREESNRREDNNLDESIKFPGDNKYISNNQPALESDQDLNGNEEDSITKSESKSILQRVKVEDSTEKVFTGDEVENSNNSSETTSIIFLSNNVKSILQNGVNVKNPENSKLGPNSNDEKITNYYKIESTPTDSNFEMNSISSNRLNIEKNVDDNRHTLDFDGTNSVEFSTSTPTTSFLKNVNSFTENRFYSSKNILDKTFDLDGYQQDSSNDSAIGSRTSTSAESIATNVDDTVKEKRVNNIEQRENTSKDEEEKIRNRVNEEQSVKTDLRERRSDYSNLKDDNSISKYNLDDVYPEIIQQNPSRMVQLVRTKRFDDSFVYPEAPDSSYVNEIDNSRAMDEPYAEDNRIIDSMLSKVDYKNIDKQERSARIDDEMPFNEEGIDPDNRREESAVRGKRGTFPRRLSKKAASQRRHRKKHKKHRKGDKKHRKSHKKNHSKHSKAKRPLRDLSTGEINDSYIKRDDINNENVEEVISPHDGRRRRKFQTDNFYFPANEAAERVRRDVQKSLEIDLNRENRETNSTKVKRETKSREKRKSSIQEHKDGKNTREAIENRNETNDKKSVKAEAAGPIGEIRQLAAQILDKVDELQSYITDGNENDEQRKNSQAFGILPNTSNVDIIVETPCNKIFQQNGNYRSAEKDSTKEAKVITQPEACWKHRSWTNVSEISKTGRSSRNPKISRCEKKLRRKRTSHRKWDRWTDWSSCSVTCGRGRQIRWRHCVRNCSTAETEMEEKACQLPACAPGKFLGIFG